MADDCNTISFFRDWRDNVKKLLNLADKHVGNRVRMRRRMLDLSQIGLADALGITFQQVQKYEKGANRVSASRLQHIASLLQVPIAFFFEGLPHYSGSSQTKTDGPNARAVTAGGTIEAWRQLGVWRVISNGGWRPTICWWWAIELFA
jgi:transcriptional regulator with XRE-family HTH domain